MVGFGKGGWFGYPGVLFALEGGAGGEGGGAAAGVEVGAEHAGIVMDGCDVLMQARGVDVGSWKALGVVWR